MARSDQTPTYNMKVVVQETGLKPDTLRAWERRYGMPSPHRTSGGHRLYSQYEIDMLKWLIARQDEGMSISNAIELWQQIENEANDPLETMPLPDEEEKGYAVSISGDSLVELREAWIDACLAFNEQAAQHILAQAFALFPVETVCIEVLQKGLVEVGEGWYEGNVSVQQEHFASAQALRQLEVLLASMSTAVRHGRILVACPPFEQHTISPLMIALMLRRRGWDVVYLGANVPLQRLESTVTQVEPQLVILAAQTLVSAASLREMANLLAELKVPLAYGGAVFNVIEETRKHIPGHFLGRRLEQTPQAVEQLLQSPLEAATVQHLSATYETALVHFRTQRAAVEADVHKHLELEEVSTVRLNNANEDLGNNIVAALTLGDMDLLDANIDWVQGLLVNYHYRMPEEAMHAYLHAYCRAAHQHLDERGQPVLTWLEKLVGSC